MAVFQVSSRGVSSGGKPVKRVSRARRRWYEVLRYIEAIVIIAGVFALAVVFLHVQWLWVLLPAGVSVVVAAITTRRARPYRLRALLLTTGVALLYVGGVIAFELFTEPATTAEVIVAATTLTAAIVFEPVHALVQAFLERRLRLRDNEITKMLDGFTSSLREEIDLNQVRERFLDVVENLLQPQYVSLWVRASAQDNRVQGRADGGSAVVVTLADTDPLIVYARRQLDLIEVDRLPSDSPAVRSWQADGIELALPLASQGELLGLLLLGPRLNAPVPKYSWLLDAIAILTVSGPFRLLVRGLRPPTREYAPEDRALLATLAAQVAPALRVALMVREERQQAVERARVEQELRTAQQIQRTFLPQEIPATRGWQLIPSYQPAREVGGDFYDFLALDDGCLGVVIGDVSGKGIPAALVMVATRTMLRTAAQENAAPGAVLARVNDMLAADVPPNVFATCFYALLDPRSGRIRYANAGHDLPYVRRANGDVEELRATGMPLGLMPEWRYEEGNAMLAPGNTLLLYTDGLVEAHDSEREMFGQQRMRALVSQHGGATLIEALLGALGNFTGTGWEQEDDVTLVTVQWADG
jgi:serine phosphatase RsbU (regulator of sigma subunit)